MNEIMKIVTFNYIIYIIFNGITQKSWYITISIPVFEQYIKFQINFKGIQKPWRPMKTLNRSSAHTPAIIMIYAKQISMGISGGPTLNNFCTFDENN